MSSRQQQRQVERALVKQGQSAVTAGLPVTARKDDLVAVAYLLGRTLRDTSLPERASDAAALVHRLCEASTRKSPGTARLACTKGCGYCCHTWVGATVPEVLLIARAIRADASRDRGSGLAGIVERSRALADKSPAERAGARLPCPLLVDNACSRYRERPSVCRQATSLDLAGCIDEYEGRGLGTAIQVSSVYIAHARNSRLPLMAALRWAGLPITVYELSAALCRVLATERAEQRWLAGEDVLAGVARAPTETAVVDQAIAEIVRGVGAVGETGRG